MRMFESVVIACDQSTLDVALAVRSALELFRLRAHLLFCVQRRNVLDALAGEIPESDYVVLCCHGLDPEGSEMQINFVVVDQVEGQWQEVRFALTPSNIPELVHLAGKTVISLGCRSGREPLAKAFLDSGCKAYIASVEPVDQDATALFTIGFFYHLLREERQPGLTCSDEEAARLAAGFDVHVRDGTGSFRYYTRTIADRRDDADRTV